MRTKEASVMPIWVFAATNRDPWQACHWGATRHPHYHDCENCDHARYGSCDIGRLYVERKQLEELKAKAQELIDSLTPYPSLDPKRLP